VSEELRRSATVPPPAPSIRSYYHATVQDFLQASADEVFGTLCTNHRFALEEAQKTAWQAEIRQLAETLKDHIDGHIFFEFEIPRIGRRADIILVSHGVIFVVEYKVGGTKYDRGAIDQVMDYALDLKNFHLGSHDAAIIPVLVATEAPDRTSPCVFDHDDIANVQLTNKRSLGDLFFTLLAAEKRKPIDATSWASSPYHPTPTIVEAAQALYRGHKVTEIARADASAINLTRTCSRIFEIVETAKSQGQKAICLITGVPGAGKTLAGLNFVTGWTKADKVSRAVFLSGNGPLVTVLREALALDAVEQQKNNLPLVGRAGLGAARREVRLFIQNIHHFRDENLRTPSAPIEKVVVFDEAQRAWNMQQTSSFMKRKKGLLDFKMSEPEFLLSVMDRHKDWCCVVCLVGGGQEINTGEAGISEWLSALQKLIPSWVVYCSDKITGSEYDWGDDLQAKLSSLKATFEPDLHLSVSLRSFRAEHLSDFIAAIISGDAAHAERMHKLIPDYPVAVTRSFQIAKAWIKRHARGSERYGVLASSNGIRLKADGIYVKQQIEPAVWFLKGKDDIRSSYYLEDIATEFDVQGLELDWAAVCWDANLRRVNGQWFRPQLQRITVAGRQRPRSEALCRERLSSLTNARTPRIRNFRSGRRRQRSNASAHCLQRDL